MLHMRLEFIRVILAFDLVSYDCIWLDWMRCGYLRLVSVVGEMRGENGNAYEWGEGVILFLIRIQPYLDYGEQNAYEYKGVE